eukprot:tig00000241_g20901.t1
MGIRDACARVPTRQSYIITHAFAALASGVTFGMSAYQMADRPPASNPRFCMMNANPLASFTTLKPVQVLNGDGSEAAQCSWPDRNTNLRMSASIIALIFSGYGFFASWSQRPIHVLLSLFLALWWTMLSWAMMLMDASTLVMVQENWRGTGASISVTPFVVTPCLGGAMIICWTAVGVIGWRWCKELVLEPEAGEMTRSPVTTLEGAHGEREREREDEEEGGGGNWFSRFGLGGGGGDKEKKPKKEKPKGFVLGETVPHPADSASGAGPSWAAGLPNDPSANPPGDTPGWYAGGGAGASASTTAPAPVQMQSGSDDAKKKQTTAKDSFFI